MYVINNDHQYISIYSTSMYIQNADSLNKTLHIYIYIYTSTHSHGLLLRCQLDLRRARLLFLSQSGLADGRNMDFLVIFHGFLYVYQRVRLKYKGGTLWLDSYTPKR